MPTVSAARGCSPTARSRRPQGVRVRKIQITTTSTNASQTIRLRSPKMSPMNGMSAISGRWTIGIRSTSGGRGRADQRPVGERRHARREDVDRGAGDDLVRHEVDREERVDQRREAAGRHRGEQPDLPRERLGRNPEAPEAAHQHHALDGDVDDAGALGHDAAEAAEHERRREPQRRREEPGRDDVADGGGVGGREQHAGDAADRGRRTAPGRRAAPRRRGSRSRRAAARPAPAPSARRSSGSGSAGRRAGRPVPPATMPAWASRFGANVRASEGAMMAPDGPLTTAPRGWAAWP